MSFLRYKRYKDSGVEWLGDVPEPWRTSRVKNTVTSCRNGVRGQEPAHDERDIACVRVADFDRRRLVAGEYVPTVRNVTASERAGRVVRRGDLLLEKSGGGDLQPVGCVVLYDSDREAICSNFIARMKIASGFDPSFCRYLHFAMYALRLTTRSINQTSGIQNLDQSAYLNEVVPLPTLEEQQAIASFLEQEAAKIDALIEEQRRLIELLREKRQAVISHAATKGLAPAVPVKESDYEWLGTVPEHWAVTPIKWVAAVESGHTPDKKVPQYWDGDIPWVSLNDTGYLKDHDHISETAYSITPEGIANSSARILPSRAVVFSRDASIGKCAITTRPMAVSQHFIAWICNDALVPEYLLHICSAMEQELERLSTGATIKTIGMADIYALASPIPPYPEQLRIVEHLSAELRRIDAAISDVVRCIDLLQERRSALISAAVTGKIDVHSDFPRKTATPEEVYELA